MEKVTIVPNGDKELLYFYKEIVLYYEKEVKGKQTGFNSRLRFFAKFVNEQKIHFVLFENRQIEMPNQYKNDHYSFIHFKQTNNHSRFASFLFHARNCFAHGRFSKVRIGNQIYLCMEDINNRGNYSMVAQIPIRQFPALLELIKQSRK